MIPKFIVYLDGIGSSTSVSVPMIYEQVQSLEAHHTTTVHVRVMDVTPAVERATITVQTTYMVPYQPQRELDFTQSDLTADKKCELCSLVDEFSDVLLGPCGN